MKRILFISPRLGQGGAERQMVTIAQLLKHKGYDVEVLCYSYGNFFEDLLHQNGIPVYWKQHNYLLRLITCTWFIQRKNYDVVISFLPTPSFINCFAASFRKKWIVITGERSSVVKAPTSVMSKIYSWYRRYSDYIVCNSDNARRMWEEVFPTYKEKMRTIYNTVILGDVTSEYIPKQDGKLHVCIAASIYGTKNPLGLVKAILLMTEEERGRIVIDWYGRSQAQIGDTKVYDETCAQIAEHRLQNVLRLHDATKDIANIMNQSDGVALFSDHEGLPNAICEGMMLGKPIVMTRVSDYNTLIEEGRNGFLCDWDNPESIKSALFRMAGLSADELIQMGNLSKEKANMLFSEEKVISEWIKLFVK